MTEPNRKTIQADDDGTVDCIDGSQLPIEFHGEPYVPNKDGRRIVLDLPNEN